ncbi:codanin-1 [Microcaecilia unicolor]|uniref:Codanin-1 n=1 Tax=Microcaecilia unicolor TaxID=1415580 RepID=A0A6P7Z406_9AMPH|nr:codanin-1 [Microcaecilia unicolor]
MAAVLELVLREEVSVSGLLCWIKERQEHQVPEESHMNASLASLSLIKKDFVPFLLNYLREQTSRILTNGPSTPAKAPNAKAHEASSDHCNKKTEWNPEKRASNSAGPRGSRVQLFSQTSNRSYTSDVSLPTCSRSGSSVFKSNLSSSYSCFPDIASHSSPSFGCSPMPYHGERRSGQKVSLGNFMVPTPDDQAPRRGRRKNSSGNAYGRQVARDLGRSLNEVDNKEENLSPSGARKQPSDSILVGVSKLELNVNNFEEFPPMSAASGLAGKTKPSRRINPTPVSAERPLSKPKICFTSTPVSHSPKSRLQSGMSPETFAAIQVGNCTSLPVHTSSRSSLQEEREMLKKERDRLLYENASLDGFALDPITPTKQSFSRSVSLSSDSLVTSADVSKVSCHKQLELLAQLYSTCIAENLVPNIFLELFFILQLLTSRGVSTKDGEDNHEFLKGCEDAIERQYFRSVHNCVYFAVQVLDYHFEIISHLEKGTLKLLAENERITAFSSGLHERLMRAYESSTAKVSLLLPSFVQSVSFQPETDNRSNFPNDKAFHIFKKQRDIFYELLREWEDHHEQPGWDFERGLGNRIRAMMAQLSPASNHSHFARLFRKQLIQMCKSPVGGRGSSSSGDAPDQDVLNMLGSDNLSRLKRLQERFIVSQSISGPCPPPTFPGCQEFFRDFILSAGSYQLNQHLMDSLCQKILELDGIALIEHEPSDHEEANVDEQDERERFTSVLMTLRLLAKFLGFITFLPYHTPEPPTRELQESAVALRNQSLPVLDVLEIVRCCIRMRRTILTVPWIVEFLSLVDHVAPLLDYYSKVFSQLLHLYRCMILKEEKEISFLNKLLILAVLGWLFQVPSVPEEMFFRSEAQQEVFLVDTTGKGQGLDCIPLVDQQLLYICCPYLGELRKLLSSFITGSGAKNGGFIRKITPTAAEPLLPRATLIEKKLQAELEQAFFHNQPPSLRRTVEFVAERVGSNCVKHIRATLVTELVRRVESLLQDKITENSNHNELLDYVCSQLCEDGKQALDKGREFCTKKGPEAVRVLLPEEMSTAVLRSAESITVGLATEKACSWLSTNIVALIKKEVKAAFNRILKSHGDSASVGVRNDVQNRKKCCREGCEHTSPFPSQIITEIKDVLCIALGPRAEDEVVQYIRLESLLGRLSQTLQCRKYICPTAEQQLAKCTIELASLLVSDKVPIQGIPKLQTQKQNEKEQVQTNPVHNLLQLLLSVWQKDFLVPVPLHLIFSLKNIGYIADAQLHEWDLFIFMLHGLIEYGIMEYTQIDQYLHSLQEFHWSPDFSSELEKVSLIFRSECCTAEPSDPVKVCEHTDSMATKS